jgi:hypothetical protein
LAGAERIECQAKSVLQHGKLKFLWRWVVLRLIGEDQNIEFYMRSGHRSYSSYPESVYFGWWVVCIHAHVLGLRDLLYP